ncbi:MAG: hypothetical protein HY537_11965 [Deltaproteobacteria bacterium]|nr:hypothetical protein [Deltaproteobacteria bacterium]
METNIRAFAIYLCLGLLLFGCGNAVTRFTDSFSCSKQDFETIAAVAKDYPSELVTGLREAKSAYTTIKRLNEKLAEHCAEPVLTACSTNNRQVVIPNREKTLVEGPIRSFGVNAYYTFTVKGYNHRMDNDVIEIKYFSSVDRKQFDSTLACYLKHAGE